MRSTLIGVGALAAIAGCNAPPSTNESTAVKASSSVAPSEPPAPASATPVPSASALPAASSSAVPPTPAFVLPKIPRTGEPVRPITFTNLDGPKKSAADFCDGKKAAADSHDPYHGCKVGKAFPVSDYPSLKSAVTKVNALTMPVGPNQQSSVGLLVETPAGFYASYDAMFPNGFIKSNSTYVSTKVSVEGDLIVLTTRANDVYQTDGRDPPPPVHSTREIAVFCAMAGVPRCSEPIRIADTAETKAPQKGEPKWAWRMTPHVTNLSIEFTSTDPKAVPPPTESPEWEITGRILRLGVYPHP